MKSILLCLLLCAPAVLAADATLPRVLILGDSVYDEPTRTVSKELKGRVEVVYLTTKPGGIFYSGIPLTRLDEMLGSGKWDLIHFNFGLGDLLYKVPGLTSIRALPKDAGAVRVTTPEQYEKNLQAIVTRLKATGAKLVWASTTPIKGSGNNTFDIGSEIEYNAIAAKVMTREGVPTNDMHAYVKSLIDMNKPAPHGWDPFYFDTKPLHPPIVGIILSQLGLK